MMDRTLDQTATSETMVPSTRALLACGVVAGPLYVIIAVTQMLARDGFDPRVHAVSLLANGEHGWIQSASFVVTGLLTLAFAVGLRRALGAATPTGRWSGRMIGLYGASLIAAGVLVADPSHGFPRGTPPGPPASVTMHGLGHMAAGGIGFLALVAACLVLARHHVQQGRRGWALHARATGLGFLAAFVGIASGGQIPGSTVAFGLAVVASWGWMSATAGRMLLRPAA